MGFIEFVTNQSTFHPRTPAIFLPDQGLIVGRHVDHLPQPYSILPCQLLQILDVPDAPIGIPGPDGPVELDVALGLELAVDHVRPVGEQQAAGPEQPTGVPAVSPSVKLIRGLTYTFSWALLC